MEQDFVDIDSFRDIEIKPPSKEWMYIQSTYIEPMFKFIKKIDIPTNTTPYFNITSKVKKKFLEFFLEIGVVLTKQWYYEKNYKTYRLQ
jgi:hypothetical protein